MVRGPGHGQVRPHLVLSKPKVFIGMSLSAFFSPQTNFDLFGYEQCLDSRDVLYPPSSSVPMSASKLRLRRPTLGREKRNSTFLLL